VNPANPECAFTEKQCQYLALIHAYSPVTGRPPAEADMQRFFAVTFPSVHQMVPTLERRGFVSRKPGSAQLLEASTSASTRKSCQNSNPSYPLCRDTRF
jgi:Mn-dependent DtxR family transcriptional regulator